MIYRSISNLIRNSESVRVMGNRSRLYVRAFTSARIEKGIDTDRVLVSCQCNGTFVIILNQSLASKRRVVKENRVRKYLLHARNSYKCIRDKFQYGCEVINLIPI